MIELLEKYPKAAKKVRDYYLEQLIKSLKDESLPDEFKKHVRQQGINNERVAKMIQGQPRALFDVFDENEIYIVINKDSTFIKPKFSYNVLLDDKNKFDSRKEAEHAAIKEAFEVLENKL